METQRGEGSSERVYEIQYNVHFDNSEDCSESDSSASYSESDPPRNKSENNVKFLSPDKHVEKGYEEEIKEDFRSKFHKAASFVHEPLPKFELENSYNDDYILDKGLMKDYQGNANINYKQDGEIHSIHESDSLNELSKSLDNNEEAIDLSLEIDDYCPNLIINAPKGDDIISNLSIDDNQNNFK